MTMEKTITVKGIGTAKVKPDYVTLSLAIDGKDKDYNGAVAAASRKIELLQAAICDIGYEKSDLKTTSYDVSADYRSEKDERGNYNSVFDGYVCSYSLSLSFDFDNQRLSETLATISACAVNPELNIFFTVKNPAEVSDVLLQRAAENARKKAEILCAASNVKLGELIHIDYNWGEITLRSSTRYDGEILFAAMAEEKTSIPAIEPDDIRAKDTVTFVWEIL